MSGPGIRVALYYAPEKDDPLTALGNAWLGRDPETGVHVPQPDIPGIAAATAAPRHYGLHATLRPPMRLATGYAQFEAAAAAAAASTAPFALPPLRVAALDRFVALVPAVANPALQALADRCIEATEPCRAPADAAELARRRAAGLKPRQERHLARFGYPYVLQDWMFHITLTGPLPADQRETWQHAAAGYFAPVLGISRVCRTLCIFTERDGAPLLIARRLPLGGATTCCLRRPGAPPLDTAGARPRPPSLM